MPEKTSSVIISCPCCATNMIYDKDGTVSGNGFECWFCPDCQYMTDDWERYPRPIIAD